MKKKVSTFFVQTVSMKNLLLGKIDRRSQRVNISPFGSLSLDESMSGKDKWDFIYVADGEAHKNHLNLFSAWKILSEEGIYPSLAITLSDRDSKVKVLLKEFVEKNKVKIFDIGYVPHKDICSFYKSSKALIYPSLVESFGLPLVEASMLSIPIIASELDYVRDVCAPVQTFDPESPLSIARAVKRFMQYKDPNFFFTPPSDFLNEVFEVKNDA
ncbi:hypothetical protein P368_08650 [Comamonas thiooxydans]|nr:hypothetical protein P369_11790 [Comamonas thiooxydans]KGG97192.1 hypothetical protein P367_17000 [Comamonas thiooxydans]KGH05716.1 hypothetical protein P365_09000 [Comamonas thiooxydans]KGH13582.1 hypothetical protein P368_08650 [Comamonas thiooxydans]